MSPRPNAAFSLSSSGVRPLSYRAARRGRRRLGGDRAAVARRAFDQQLGELDLLRRPLGQPAGGRVERLVVDRLRLADGDALAAGGRETRVPPPCIG